MALLYENNHCNIYNNIYCVIIQLLKDHITRPHSILSSFTPLIKSKDSNTIRVLLTNTTQETSVLDQAASASSALASAWESAQGAANPSPFVTAIQAAAAKVFRELIDITTEVEIQYILARLN